MSFGDLELHDHFDIFSLGVKTKVVPARVQQPITNSTGPWDDFVVNGVNSPSFHEEVQHVELHLELHRPSN
jgi:hypothetical protein